jgi:hypothetical protein
VGGLLHCLPIRGARVVDSSPTVEYARAAARVAPTCGWQTCGHRQNLRTSQSVTVQQNTAKHWQNPTPVPQVPVTTVTKTPRSPTGYRLIAHRRYHPLAFPFPCIATQVMPLMRRLTHLAALASSTGPWAGTGPPPRSLAARQAQSSTPHLPPHFHLEYCSPRPEGAR